MRSDTRTGLIDTATAQVRRQGYAGFSYADLSGAAGLRKASIHHHFPTKEDLGVAIVDAYSERFAARLARIDAHGGDARKRLRAFAGLYREGLAAGQACLCGVLASEIAVLPLRVQAGVRRFFDMNLRWLERTLREGRGAELRPTINPRQDARTVLAALQGAMIVSLSLQEPSAFDQAAAGLLRGLTAGQGA